MAKTIPVSCGCGIIVPVYLYCHKCRQVSGEPNCPCGRPIAPIKVWECATCNPADEDRVRKSIIREYEAKVHFPCENCVIPTCGSCGKADRAEVICPACHRRECSRCSSVCTKALEQKSKRVDSTVTYSGTGMKYKKGADKDRPKMFVESWYYKGGRCINRTLVGFEKKES